MSRHSISLARGLILDSRGVIGQSLLLDAGGLMLQALSEKHNSFLRLLKKKGFKEERVTTIGLYDIDTSHDSGIQQEPRGQCMHWSRGYTQLSGDNEGDLFPNLSVFGSGFEFDHLPRLRLHLHAVCERIHRHHRGKHRPRHLSRGAACTGPLLLTGLDVDDRLRGDFHLDYLAMHVRDVPGLFCAFDMHHGCAQRLPKGAGRDKRGDGEDDPEQAQSAWTRLAMHIVTPLCDPTPKCRHQGRR